MLDKPLNDREQRFVEEYLIDLDPRRAALAAGYSRSTAATKSYQWVSKSDQKPHVFAAIAGAKAARSETTRIDAQYVLEHLVKLERASIGDFLTFPEGGGMPRFDLSAATQAQLASIEGLQLDVHREKSEDGGVVEKIKITLPNKLRALELIGKHVDVQAYLDKQKVEVNDLSSLTREERGIFIDVLQSLKAEREAAKDDEDTVH
jgi:phage terminase small subunit